MIINVNLQIASGPFRLFRLDTSKSSPTEVFVCNIEDEVTLSSYFELADDPEPDFVVRDCDGILCRSQNDTRHYDTSEWTSGADGELFRVDPQSGVRITISKSKKHSGSAWTVSSFQPGQEKEGDLFYAIFSRALLSGRTRFNAMVSRYVEHALKGQSIEA